MLSCFTNPANTNSDSSPEERPEPENLKLNSEEFEKLDIQPFEKPSKNDATSTIFELNDQILERTNEELEDESSLNPQKFEEERSPEIKIRNNKNINMNITLTEPNGCDSGENEDFIGEIIKRHRYTFSKRMVDSKKEKPEDFEQKYMSAMGKSIVALNYKSKISRNPMKKFSTFYPQSSVEETKENEETQYSPTNKITLIPISKCFKMGSMQEINFEKQSSQNSGHFSEKHQIVSNINIASVVEEKSNPSIQEQPSFFKETRKEKVGDKLFEDLLIIGVDKTDISSAITSENQKNLTITPKILYSFRPESDSIEIESILLLFLLILWGFFMFFIDFSSSIRKILPDYCFPFRLNVEKIDVGSSMSYTSVLMVMYPSVNIFEGRDKCFITTLSCEDTYKNHQDDGSFLHKINPNRVLHCICLKTTDYIESVMFFLGFPLVFVNIFVNVFLDGPCDFEKKKQKL